MIDIIDGVLSTNVAFFVFFIIGLFAVFKTIFHVLLAILGYIIVMHVLFSKDEGFSSILSTHTESKQVKNGVKYIKKEPLNAICLTSVGNEVVDGQWRHNKNFVAQGASRGFHTSCQKVCTNDNPEKCLDALYKKHKNN